MRVQNINSQNFEVRKFRINRTFLEPSGIFSPSRYDVEFEDAELAQKWFSQAQKAQTVQERAECFEKMGEYRIIDREQEKFIDKKFSKWAIFKMQLKDKIKMVEGKVNGLFR